MKTNGLEKRQNSLLGHSIKEEVDIVWISKWILTTIIDLGSIEAHKLMFLAPTKAHNLLFLKPKEAQQSSMLEHAQYWYIISRPNVTLKAWRRSSINKGHAGLAKLRTTVKVMVEIVFGYGCREVTRGSRNDCHLLVVLLPTANGGASQRPWDTGKLFECRSRDIDQN